MGGRTSSETPKDCPTQVSGLKALEDPKGTSKDLSTQAAHHGVNLKPMSGTREWLQEEAVDGYTSWYTCVERSAKKGFWIPMSTPRARSRHSVHHGKYHSASCSLFAQLHQSIMPSSGPCMTHMSHQDLPPPAQLRQLWTLDRT